ncbi:hypothetical protein ACQP00_11795 [Dactylosporangium sp. CS-047395]|uniref:hypothetical protein n=1 Tax=Dactylosporangium sp. CS-047395 TaxID=3239936 RepID=UPI003D92B7C1
MNPDAVLAVLRSFEAPPERHRAYADRMRWFAARFDAGDRAAAAEGVLAELGSGFDESFAADGPRILAVLPPERVLAAILQSPQLYSRWWRTSGQRPEDHVAGVLARAVAGTPAAEEALLRAVLPPTDHERKYPNHLDRAKRVSGTVAGLASAYPDGDLEPLDRWSAILEDEPHHLAAAAHLLAPHGLAAAEARCGRVDDHDGPALVAALGAAGRLDDALALAARLEPRTRQTALVRLAPIGDPKILAAFKKSPKASRSRDDQMLWRHRLGSLQLRYGAIDDAIATLASMRDCRYAEYGPAVLALELLRALDAGEADPERLDKVLAVLLSAAVIPQELAAVVTESVLLLHRNGALTAAQAQALRAHLRQHPADLVAGGLALDGAQPDTGDPRVWLKSARLAAAAMAAGLPAARPREYAAALVARPADLTALVPAVPAGDVAVALAALGERDRSRAVQAMSRTGNADLLAVALPAAPDAEAAYAVGRAVAVALARSGDLEPAVRVAEACVR